MKLPPENTLSELFFNEKSATEFLQSKGCFYESIECPKCESIMRLVEGTRKRFRCKCRAELSWKAHSFFQHTHLETNQVLRLGYMWLNRSSTDQMRNVTGLSPQTIVKFTGHFRQLVSSTLEEDDSTIGGPGIIVEIDETKMGKRKYNQGHHVDGVWLLVGVERTPERKVFIKKVDDRRAETLELIITRYVLLGSIIHTDLWKGYSGLSELGYDHRTVNHSVGFKNSENGTHTNTVEGTNNGLKIFIRPRNRTQKIDTHLDEFIWRRKHAERLWEAFIEALKDIHYE